MDSMSCNQFQDRMGILDLIGNLLLNNINLGLAMGKDDLICSLRSLVASNSSTFHYHMSSVNYLNDYRLDSILKLSRKYKEDYFSNYHVHNKLDLSRKDKVCY